MCSSVTSARLIREREQASARAHERSHNRHFLSNATIFNQTNGTQVRALFAVMKYRNSIFFSLPGNVILLPQNR